MICVWTVLQVFFHRNWLSLSDDSDFDVDFGWNVHFNFPGVLLIEVGLKVF